MNANDMIPTDTPHDSIQAVHHLVLLDAVTSVSKQRQDETRAYLENEARQIASLQGGGGYTARLGVGQVILTNPEPKGRVTDEAALAEWLDEHEPRLVMRAAQVIVHPDARLGDLREAAASILNDPSDAEAAAALATMVLDAITWHDPIHLPEDPIGAMADRVVVTEQGVVDRITGEVVPGTDVSVAPQRLQVRLDKRTREEAANNLRAALGMEVER